MTIRDRWVQAAPGRGFEVWTNESRTHWRVELTEWGEVVSSGEGEDWELALTVALSHSHFGGTA